MFASALSIPSLTSPPRLRLSKAHPCPQRTLLAPSAPPVPNSWFLASCHLPLIQDAELESKKHALLRAVQDTQRGLITTADQRSSIERGLGTRMRNITDFCKIFSSF
ncbi:hypothetical protein J5N97_001042 [Dioscorea zingiberensis]|uniref:Uncharacterized protein n=1 Tax=Dioscorea zingiberensis TaxID=325984 RepID=A0A9D5H2Q5_9LILI|nr:hypothetical protein J5N97_001042 [Dioscorea zingiberensis]